MFRRSEAQNADTFKEYLTFTNEILRKLQEFHHHLNMDGDEVNNNNIW